MTPTLLLPSTPLLPGSPSMDPDLGVVTPAAATKGWRFYLIRSTDQVRIGEFTKMKARTLTLRLNQPGSFTGSVSMDDPSASLINTVTTGIQAVQDGVIRWSGLILTARHSSDGVNRNIDVQAIGWFELLNHRSMRDNTVDYATNLVTNGGFESGVTGWTGTNFAASAVQKHSGANSILFSRAAAGTGADYAEATAAVYFPSVAGAIHQVSYWIYIPTIANVFQFQVYVNQGGTTVAKSVITASGSISAGTWTQFTTQWVGDGNLTKIGVAVSTNVGYPGGGAQIAFIDDITVTLEQGVWGLLDIGETALRLVDYANLRWPTVVSRGTAQPSWVLQSEYRPFQNIGQEIKRLSDVENGFDFEVDPATRQLNIYWPMKGKFKTRYDTSIRAHNKMGAEYLWQFDSTVTDADVISGSPLTAVTGASQVSTLQSFSPSGHAVSRIVNPGDAQGVAQLTQTVDLAMGQNYAISMLINVAGFPSNSGKALFFATNASTLAAATTAIYTDVSGTLYFRVSATNTIQSAPGVIRAATTHHIVACYDGNTQRLFLYVDSVLVAFTPPAPVITNPAIQTGATLQNYMINETGSGQLMQCQLDELAIWRGRTISAVEVYHLYNVLRVQTGTEVETVKFGFGSRGPSNLTSVQKVQDATRMTNFFFGQGKGGISSGAAVALDLGSMITYGEWDESGQLSEIALSDVLSSYAMSEVAVRGRPLVIYAMKPLRTNSNPPQVRTVIPRPFIDYTVGDIVSFDARDGTIDVQSETARIFGITVALDDAGNEDVTLETSLGGS